MPQQKGASSSKRGGRKKTLGLLRGIGLHGYEPIEDAFLAGLVLKEPVLLIGSIGTAKTLLAERIALALGLKFHAYDASKAMFEDILGFPDPKVLLEEHKVCYVPSDITIWDKELIFVDELSRALPHMQNKWLEIIHSRQFMGILLDRVQYVVAAMNPPNMLGTGPLDHALAGRFAFIIQVPSIHEMQ